MKMFTREFEYLHGSMAEKLRPNPTRKGVGSLSFMLRLGLLLGAVAETSCSYLPGVGPTKQEIQDSAKPNSLGQARFALIDLSSSIVEAMRKWSVPSLQLTFGNVRPPAAQTIGIGDSLQIVVWEAGAGGLFSAPTVDRSSPGSRTAVIPEQAVGNDGAITVPYAGRIRAAGRTPQDVEQSIVDGLKGKAIEPQALVTVKNNVSNTVTVIGDVTSGARVPLTARGDRILDVIAAAGGVKAPIYDTFLTLSRSGHSTRVPLQSILLNPQENIFVIPADVVTVAREPQTFTAIGATGKNAVLPFDSVGLSLEEAVGRAGGLDDQRADPHGVFVVRYERSDDYAQLGVARPSEGPADEVPTIYRVDMKDPNSLFLARRFPMRNKDILFVSNAPATDLQKLGMILSTFLIPAGTAIGVVAISKP